MDQKEHSRDVGILTDEVDFDILLQLNSITNCYHIGLMRHKIYFFWHLLGRKNAYHTMW